MYPKITVFGWVRIAVRLFFIAVSLAFGILLMLIIRPVERRFTGLRRPISGHIPPLMSRWILRFMGLRFSTHGTPMKQGGAVVANHSSWLDILTLNARNPVVFVSKVEVEGWPGVGFLAKLVGTIFIARDPKEAKNQQLQFEHCLTAGQKLLFFPEGTSTDTKLVLPFKSTLFAAFFAENLRPIMQIQPVTVNYFAPKGADPRFYGWWGDMDFGAHILNMLAAPRHGRVEVTYHPEVSPVDFKNRKTMASYCQAQVLSVHKSVTLES